MPRAGRFFLHPSEPSAFNPCAARPTHANPSNPPSFGHTPHGAAVVSASLLPSVASAAIPTVSWAVDASGQWTTLTNWSPARAINYDNVVIARPAGT